MTPLRVLQLTTGGLPHLIGGRDVFTHELGRALAARRHTVLTAYHQNVEPPEPVGPYTHDGVDYEVLPVVPDARRRSAVALRTTADPVGYAALLDRFRPDVVHLHDFAPGCGVTHLRMARARGIRTAATYHSPGQSCQQRELRRHGRTVCDGELLVGRCAACRLSAAGLPTPAAVAIARLPLTAVAVDTDSRLGRVLSSRAATRLFLRGWRELVAGLDLFHCHAGWVADLLRLNGVPAEKLRLFRTGLPRPLGPVERRPAPDGRLRVTFLGRCDRVKGIETLVAAVRRLPADAPLRVAFVGPGFDSPYGRAALAGTAGDERFLPPQVVPPAELGGVWADTDILAVPSLWLETGPLVVLEAFAAGVPVVGSRLGGIRELVDDGRTGLLHEPGDAIGLTDRLGHLLADPGQLPKLRANIRPPRTLSDLADDLLPEYHRLLAAPA